MEEHGFDMPPELMDSVLTDRISLASSVAPSELAVTISTEGGRTPRGGGHTTPRGGAPGAGESSTIRTAPPPAARRPPAPARSASESAGEVRGTRVRGRGDDKMVSSKVTLPHLIAHFPLNTFHHINIRRERGTRFKLNPPRQQKGVVRLYQTI
jgi:pyruvate/2-oxoglutarate dehydrogenase complex dihydrolipoamide acyltransferase (E2) component